MRLELRNKVPSAYNAQTWQDIVTALQNQINQLSEGRLAARHNATTAAPTVGEYAVGDFVPNSNVQELGSSSSKFFIAGWVCTDTDPLTFVQARCLTGN